LFNQVIFFLGRVIKDYNIAVLFSRIILSFIRAFESWLLVVGVGRFRTRRYVVGYIYNKCVVLLRLGDIFAKADR
jgi:hypothetical protein